jgi:hypothetical protein
MFKHLLNFMFFSEGILLFSSFFKEKNNNEIIHAMMLTINDKLCSGVKSVDNPLTKLFMQLK